MKRTFQHGSQILIFLTALLCFSGIGQSAISVGGRVKITQNGVNVRAGAGSTTINGQQNTGALGTVVGGPTNAQIAGTGTTYKWWNVNFDSGKDGWVADINLAEVTASAPGSFTLSFETPVWDTANPPGPAVRLNWTPSSGATSYEIYRNGTKIYPTSGTFSGATFRNETGLTSGQTYSYYVIARNATGTKQSNTISVGPMPSAPASAPGSFTLSYEAPVWDTATPPGPAVRLNWTQSSGATSYEIYRDGTKIYPTSGTFSGTTFRNETGLTSGQTYSYYVIARNATGTKQSNTISVGPMPSAPAGPSNYTINLSASPSAGGTVSGAGTYAAGSLRTVTASASSGYTFASWKENGTVVSTSASYPFTLNGNRTLVANFTTGATTYTVTPSAGANGSISPSGVQTVNSGGSATFTATPMPGYMVNQWLVNGSLAQTGGNSYTLSGVTANKTVQVTFKAATPDGVLFSDDFNDNSIALVKWSTAGNIVTETGQTMHVSTTVTDQPGKLTSTPFAVNRNGIITITRKVFLHHDDSRSFGGNTRFFTGRFSVFLSGSIKFSIAYEAYDYSSPSDLPKHGFFITRNGASAHSPSQQADVSTGCTAVWDTWFTEKISYDPATGALEYFINNVSKITFNVGSMAVSTTPTMALYFDAYGWWTGHYQYFDDLLVTQGMPLSSYTVTPSAGANGSISPSGVQTVNSGGSATFTATPMPGYMVNQWLVNGSLAQTGGNSYTLSGVTANKTVQVTFKASQTTSNYTINLSASPSAGGTVSGAGTYAAGSLRTVTASASSGYSFASWKENGTVVSTSASYPFTLNGNRTLVANFTTGATGPTNNNFSSRTPIQAAGGTVNGSNVNATKESGEPNHHGYVGGKSVWWTWTPSASGTAVISTAGSGFDTILGIYTGTSVSALTVRGSNDDFNGNTSQVSFSVTAGTAYQIAVDGLNGVSGSITLRVTPPEITTPVLTRAQAGYQWPTSFGNSSQSRIIGRMNEMFNASWQPSANFVNWRLTGYTGNYTQGIRYYGLPYSQANPQTDRNGFYGYLPAMRGTLNSATSAGVDCSGSISIAWELPQRLATVHFDVSTSTYFITVVPNGQLVTRASDIQPGDAIVSSRWVTDAQGNNSGHMVLVLSAPVNGRVTVLESTSDQGTNSEGSAQRWAVVSNTRSLSDLNARYCRVIRRNKLN